MPIWGYVLIGIAVFLLLFLLIEYLMWKKILVTCEHCGYVYKPKFIKFLFSWRMFNHIYLRCPKCGESGGHQVET